LNLFRKSIIIFIISIYSCDIVQDNKSEIKKIPIEIKLERFDKYFYDKEKYSLKSLKEKFPFFFPITYSDSVWVKKRNDTLIRILNSEISKKIINNSLLIDPLKLMFKHIKYYFPNYQIPRVISVSNNVDYNNRIIMNDSLLIISIDTYLGSENKIYNGIPNFIRYEMDLSFLTSHVINKFSKYHVKKTNDRTFLAEIIYHGKKHYLKDLLLPNNNEKIKIGFSEKKLRWAKENEIFIWKYFIENKLLYSTNQELMNRFINPAPFSKFYLELDNESPGKIGQWIGWNIVKSYVKNNPTVSLSEILKKSEFEIFQYSKYKPLK
tara:strand:+ start:36608 stop:37573 length:966 start_codon:yes stop_codon:yes gene_type:complete